MNGSAFDFGFKRFYLGLFIVDALSVLVISISEDIITSIAFLILLFASIIIFVQSALSRDHLIITNNRIVIKYPFIQREYLIKNYSQFRIEGKGLFSRIIAYNSINRKKETIVKNQYKATLQTILLSINNHLENWNV